MSKEKPIKSVEVNDDFALGDRLHIPKAIKEEILGKGLEYRWISIKQMEVMGGYHHMGWIPYKPDIQNKALGGLSFGKNAEGYLIRGGSILAARAKELCDEHRTRLKQKQELSNAVGLQNKVKNGKVNSI